MATDFKSIPIIDMSPVLAKCDDPKMGENPGVAQVVRLLDHASRGAGFFYVGSTFIGSIWEAPKYILQSGDTRPWYSKSLIKDVQALSHKFFELSYEEKLNIKMTPAAGYRGYQRIGENITKGVPDMHEAIDCYREVKRGMHGDLGKIMEGCNRWPHTPADLKPVMEEYFSLCTGLLTLVNQDDSINALQVRNLSGEWISAVPVPGTFICNIGDMLKIWSNGLYHFTFHRVINNSPVCRVCVAYFYETNFDFAVEPLDFCVMKTSGSKKFGRAVYGEHLVGKVRTNFVT